MEYYTNISMMTCTNECLLLHSKYIFMFRITVKVLNIFLIVLVIFSIWYYPQETHFYLSVTKCYKTLFRDFMYYSLGREEGNVLFNNTLDTFYLVIWHRTYGKGPY